MKKSAVIGNPISHSLSPLIHQTIARALGVSLFGYEAVELSVELSPHTLPETLSPWVETVRTNREWLGFNVTSPFKEQIMPLLDELSPEVRMIGAVNCVRRLQHLDDVKLIGSNTDVIGIERTIELNKINLEGKNVFIFGAGGAAKAVNFVCGKLGARTVVIQNRDSMRAKKLADDFSNLYPNTTFCAPESFDGFESLEFQLVVNATSPKNTAFQLINRLQVVDTILAFDLTYTTHQTEFLLAARRRRFRCINGLDMLIDQAVASWNVWLPDQIIDRARIRVEVVSALGRHVQIARQFQRSIFLTGFMGSGKSTIGRMIASELNMPFFDTDQLIEQREGKSVAELYRERGEEHFRALESRLISELVRESHSVISLGGGSLTHLESLEKILASGLLIYLRMTAATLEKRLSHEQTNRPLLAGMTLKDRRKKIDELLITRKPAYDRAKWAIDCDSFTTEETVKAVLSTIVKEETVGSV